MKKVLLNILKEIGIGLAILVVLIAVAIVAFKDQLPYDEVIRNGEEYEKANLKEYSVSSSDRIQEVTAITVTHEAESNQIVEAENEVRIQTGKNTPFGSISGTTDLPTEKVGQSLTITETPSSTNKDNTSTTTNNPGIEYPVSEKDIDKVIEEGEKTPQEAAASRFENVKE